MAIVLQVSILAARFLLLDSSWGWRRRPRPSRGPWQAAGRTIASSRAWKSSFVIRHPPPPVRGRPVTFPRPTIHMKDSHHGDDTWQNGNRRPSSTPAAALATVAAAAARRGRVAARRAARGSAGAAAGREQEQQQQEKGKRWCGVAGGCPGCIGGAHLAGPVSSPTLKVTLNCLKLLLPVTSSQASCASGL